MTKEEKKEFEEQINSSGMLPEKIKVVDLDDEIDFKCQQCGKCCMDRNDIIVNPLDIYNISKYLKMQPGDVIDKYFNIDLGGNSKIPIIFLKPLGNGFCPFLNTDHANKSKFVCSINPVKPNACYLHPLGAARNMSSGKNEVCFIKVEQCPQSKGHNNKIKVRDFVQRYLDSEDDIKIANRLQTIIEEFFPANLIYLLCTMFPDKCFPSDDYRPFLKNLYYSFVSGYIHFAYENYVSERPFDQQAEDNMEKLKEMLSDIKISLFFMCEKLNDITKDMVNKILKKENAFKFMESVSKEDLKNFENKLKRKEF